MALSLTCLALKEPELRDVYIRGIRGDLWDWLFIWKQRLPFASIINILILEFRELSETERQKILAKYDLPPGERRQ